MKKKVSNLKSLLLCLLLTAVVSFSLSAQDAVKDFSESYDVKRGVTLSSDTKYTDVELVNWDKDVVDIYAEIKIDASSKSKAEDKLEKIDVKIGKSGNIITVVTEFGEGWSNNVDVDIKITVKAPTYLSLTMECAYGDVFIQDLSGLALLDLKYSNLQAGSLSRGNEKPFNKLDLAYSDATIDKAGWLEVELAYSEMNVASSGMLFVESKYSKLMGEKTGGIVTEGAYDKYYFDDVDNFVGELKYSGIKFGALNKKFEVDSKYTNIKILGVSKDFKEISASSSYGNIHLEMEERASFKIESEAKYGKISLDMDGKLSKVEENNYMKVWGTVGNAPKGSLSLEARYGNISIE